ncbi:hypothetical protein [Cryptosporangium sp. NPDC051539]|uniref:hypothetical protein n=1 Tax=Cryptosporangium sp. NPDC051539 TaxID=3363962 RepID=UPI0037BE1FBC
MASELERLASQLRFLAEQVRQQRGPLVGASQKLATAAGAVRHLEIEYDDGRKEAVPADVSTQLSDASKSAKDVVGSLGETAELLSMFASRLATGMSGARTGEPQPAEDYEPAGSTTDAPPSASDPARPGLKADRRSSYPTREMPPEPHESGSVARPRYGRYPTTTAARFAPGNRSYEVGT